jgi:hypothetical protein
MPIVDVGPEVGGFHADHYEDLRFRRRRNSAASGLRGQGGQRNDPNKQGGQVPTGARSIPSDANYRGQSNRHRRLRVFA